MDKNDNLDLEQMAEAELNRLQRQYRIMEGDRRAFLDEISIKLKRQRSIIKRLKTEKENLLADVVVATSVGRKRKDSKDSWKLECLLQKYNDVVKEMKEQKAKLEEIDDQIKKTERQVEKLRLKKITDLEFEARVQSGQKSVQILENKLNTTVKRFCATLTDNQRMRNEIDHLLKERTRFNAVWEKLVEDLESGKKFLLELIEQATVAYDQREEWCSKLQALKIRAHNDIIGHTQDMREMQRQLDHDGKLREFLTIKGQRRVMKDLEEKEMRKKETETKQLEEKVQEYEVTLEQIKMFCNEEDIERIAIKYTKQEEENFALFNYVNELNHELEILEESIKELSEKLEEQEEKCKENKTKNRMTFDSLMEDLENAKKQAKDDEEELKNVENELKEILDGVWGIFKQVNCDITPILDLLGTNSKINEDNVFIYFGLIERQVSEMITTMYFKEKSLVKRK